MYIQCIHIVYTMPNQRLQFSNVKANLLGTIIANTYGNISSIYGRTYYMHEHMYSMYGTSTAYMDVYIVYMAIYAYIIYVDRYKKKGYKWNLGIIQQ